MRVMPGGPGQAGFPMEGQFPLLQGGEQPERGVSSQALFGLPAQSQDPLVSPLQGQEMDRHLSAAAGGSAVLLGQCHGPGPGAGSAKQLPRDRNAAPLHSAAADGAGQQALAACQHPGARLPGGDAGGFNDGHQDHPLPPGKGVADVLEQFSHG